MESSRSLHSVVARGGRDDDGSESRTSRLLAWLSEDWQPRLSVPMLLTLLSLIALVCVGCGVAALLASNSVVEVSARYDNVCGRRTHCSVQLRVPREVRTFTDIIFVSAAECSLLQMVAPIYFYYRLTSYGQNSRRYVKSRSDAQLQGAVLLTDEELADCNPRETTRAGKTQYPCGLVASTFFNDDFNVTSRGAVLSGDDWDASAIAWPSDVGVKFVVRPLDASESRVIERDGESLTLPPLDDQGLMVWMRPAALPDFSKLYRVIGATTLAADDVITVNIRNRFVHPSADGQKHVVLSTTSWLGGKNPFIGVLFLVCAGLLWASAIAIFFIDRYIPVARRKYGKRHHRRRHRCAMRARLTRCVQ